MLRRGGASPGWSQVFITGILSRHYVNMIVAARFISSIFRSEFTPQEFHIFFQCIRIILLSFPSVYSSCNSVIFDLYDDGWLGEDCKSVSHTKGLILFCLCEIHSGPNLKASDPRSRKVFPTSPVALGSEEFSGGQSLISVVVTIIKCCLHVLLFFLENFIKVFLSQTDNICWGARSQMLPFVCAFTTIKTSCGFGKVLLQCFPYMSDQENYLCCLLKIQTTQPHPEIIYVRISGEESQPSIFQQTLWTSF